MTTPKMMESFDQDIRQAADILKQGGIILYPTDTVWGIGCDATNPEAVEKIYRLKRRADSKSMLVLVDGEGMLQRFVRHIPDTAWQLIDVATDPLTIIYDHPLGVAANLLAEDGSLGVRISHEPYSEKLTRRLGRPIVSTSANISDRPTPAIFSEIEPEILEGVDYVAHYRRDDTTRHKSSAIIKVGDDEVIKLIR